MIFGFIHKKNEYRFPFGAFHAALCLCFIANLLLGNVSTFGYSLPFHEAFDTSSVWNSQTVRGSDWQQGQPNYGQTNSTHSGSSCWDVSLNTAYRDSSLSYLISPSIDFNGEYNAQLSFWQNCNTEDLFDGARLDYSMNGGGWITLGMSGDPNGSNWYTRNNIASSNKPAWCGNSNGWINSSYTLVPLNGFTGTVRFRFVFTSNDSTQADGFSIDDFFIEPAPALDAGIESVIFPLPFAMENNFDSIQVLVKNYGAGPINSMSISYSLDGGVPISQTWNGNLLPAETDTFRFSTLWFVQSGFNSMCVFTALAGDANSWNDSVCKSIEGISVNTIPFADDFEVNNNQFHDSSYSGTHWEYGSPAFGSTSSSYSGSKCWDLNLNSAYSNHATSYLYSSFYDFTGVMNAKLSFWQNRNTERGFDGMCMEYSTDAGCTWSLLGSTSEENSLNWYNDSSISALGNYAGWDGNSGGWIQSSCILAALNSAGARVQFRFRFQSDGSTTSDGVSIDDFRIQPAPTTDLSLNAVRSPVGNKPENTVDTIRIRVRNLGMTDIHQFTLSYGVSGEIPRTLNWNGTL
ncbi:MAG TPA: hypothetical protein PKL85_13350, partial [Bacteroidia bacterium]|nr:hypothetical protein [Bacteroidia bacterium]